jgi:5-methyltetrahydropteroyltriglutamate--homocysteine methyltransferase
MKRSDGRILTTHTGSLVRPSELTALSPAFSRDAAPSPPTEEEVSRLEERLRGDVEDVVRAQLEAGLDVVNDGEYGKSSWSAYIMARISGFEIRRDQLKPLDWLGRDRERFPGFFESSEMGNALRGAPAEVCIGPVAYVDRSGLERDLENLSAGAARVGVIEDGKEVFFTSVAPASTAYQGINEYYRTEEEYIYAIADALRQEYRAIHAAGFLLQVDDAVLANMYDHLVEQGEDVYHRWAQLRVEALNHALEGIPSERVRYHVCFGSWHVPHVADAPLEALAEFILQVNAGAYSIEAANARHEHEWQIWEHTKLPDEKILVPGVITHHTTTVEHPELVAQRIERFANLVGRERVIAGTDCGFAQAARIRRVHPEVMWAKFASLVTGAQLASSRLWG